jgi:flagellar hook assembly protein FlgD
VQVKEGALKVFPMPVDNYANISFSLNAASEVEMSIYNIVGAKVTSVEYGRFPAGEHTITWNGASDSGQILETGMYILRMKAGNNVSSFKILKR